MKRLAVYILTVLLIGISGSICLADESIIFSDNFNDDKIDPTKWVSNGRTGGSVIEDDGVMKVKVYNGNDIQYRTASNLLSGTDNLSIEFRVQARSVAPDKNAGFWLGDADGNVGFQCNFSQKWQRFTTPIGSLGSQFGTESVSVGGGDSAMWHDVQILKEGSDYSIYLDNNLVGKSDAIQPDSLYFSGGYQWKANYGYEAADLYFDDLIVSTQIQETHVPTTYGLFIGTNDGLNEGLKYRGDIAMQELSSQMIESGVLQEKNTVVLTNNANHKITSEDIQETIESFGLKPGDELYFAFNGHGGVYENGTGSRYGETTVTAGDEAIVLDGEYELRDDNLVNLLEAIDKYVAITIILDSCNSGGFWGNGEESDYNNDGKPDGDIDRLINACLIAGASETSYTISSIDFGSLFTNILKSGYTREETPNGPGYMKADKNKDNRISEVEWREYLKWYDILPFLDSEVYTWGFEEGGNEGPIPFTAEMWNPIVLATEKYSGGNYQMSATPEPASLLLFGSGMAGLAWFRRRRKHRS